MANNFNIDKIVGNVNKVLTKNTKDACVHAARQIKKNISRSQPRVRVGKTMIGREPSKENEFPKVVTGALRSSVDFEIDNTKLTVHGYVGLKQGITEKYGLALELGTPWMGKRPYIRKTILEERDKLGKLIVGKK